MVRNNINYSSSRSALHGRSISIRGMKDDNAALRGRKRRPRKCATRRTKRYVFALHWRASGSLKCNSSSGAFPMRPRSATYPFCVLAAALALATAARAEVGPTCFPANNATHVNPDTHLLLTFFSPPTLGKSGQIRIYDAAGHHLV